MISNYTVVRTHQLTSNPELRRSSKDWKRTRLDDRPANSKKSCKPKQQPACPLTHPGHQQQAVIRFPPAQRESAPTVAWLDTSRPTRSMKQPTPCNPPSPSDVCFSPPPLPPRLGWLNPHRETGSNAKSALRDAKWRTKQFHELLHTGARQVRRATKAQAENDAKQRRAEEKEIKQQRTAEERLQRAKQAEIRKKKQEKTRAKKKEKQEKKRKRRLLRTRPDNQWLHMSAKTGT